MSTEVRTKNKPSCSCEMQCTCKNNVNEQYDIKLLKAFHPVDVNDRAQLRIFLYSAKKNDDEVLTFRGSVANKKMRMKNTKCSADDARKIRACVFRES